ncbi:MFS transporter [Burkholderiales bacterium]|nr:MFS transporter [Burkholderiales bacterium]
MNNDRTFLVDSLSAWLRLSVALSMSVVVGVGMWSIVVILPAIQADLGLTRGQASLPYAFTMIGYGLGGIVFGRFSDKHGIYKTVVAGIVLMSIGYVAASFATSVWFLCLSQGLLIGIGTSTTFAPLIAHVSHWFERRKGAAVGIIASGQYLSGAIWPTILEVGVQGFGWQQTYWFIGAIVLGLALPLSLVLRSVPFTDESIAISHDDSDQKRCLVSKTWLIVLLMVSIFCCCVAMAMPQVHLVAFCGDLGFGAAAGAKMLSVMLAFGVASRLGFGWLSDYIGGLKTVVIGVFLQSIGLALFLFFDTLLSLYVISALFGLFQGGIVPAYALAVREYFPQRVAGERVGMVMMASLLGMAIGGWMPGYLFDLTGSYDFAFMNGLLWNTLPIFLLGWLIIRIRKMSLSR